MDFRELRRESQRIGNTLAREQGIRDNLVQQRDDLNAKVIIHQHDAERAKQGHLFLLGEIVDRRQKTLSKLEDVGTAGTRSVYGDEWSVKFRTFEEKRKEEGAANFKMEMSLVTEVDGHVRYVPITGGIGGGAFEVNGHSMRFGSLELLKYLGPIVMDETFKSMSNDQKLEEVAALMKNLCHTFKRQVLLCTHQRDVFAPVADCILYVTQNEKHVSRVDRIVADGEAAIDEEDYEYDG